MPNTGTPMSDIVSGVVGVKLAPPLIAFLGAVTTISYMPELTRRQWLSAVMFGVLSAYYIPPIAGYWLRQQYPWIPADGSVEGLAGLILGLGSIHIIGALTTMGKRFSSDPVGTIKRAGSKK